MNEGHAALLTLALIESQLGGGPLGAPTEADLALVRQKCVFTTHTPVPAGHDRFSTEQTIRILGGDRTARLEKLGCYRDGMLNMTLLALKFSRYCNGVAMQHAKVSRPCSRSFPSIRSPTAFTRPPGFPSRCSRCWMRTFRRGGGTIFTCATRSTCRRRRSLPRTRGPKESLLAEVGSRTGLVLDPKVLTLGFARRVATYKRATLLFTDPERLVEIAKAAGGLQIIYAGKAHPQDEPGKALIQKGGGGCGEILQQPAEDCVSGKLCMGPGRAC
jgi:starch phosphorylase